MIRRMVVGLSGSEFSSAAVEASLSWAKARGSELIGVAAVDVPGLTAAEPVPLGASSFKVQRDQTLVEQASANADRWLAEFASACRARQVPHQTVKRAGDPAIVLETEAQRGDLLVVGRKRGGEDSTATLQHVLRSATRPVLTVPDGEVAETGCVLVAYDGSPQAAKTLQVFQTLGLAAGHAMHVLSVEPNPLHVSPAELAADYLRLHGHEAEIHREISSQPPASLILEAAARLEARLIVLGSYGRGKVAEWFFGSVARTLLSESDVPLFLFH